MNVMCLRRNDVDSCEFVSISLAYDRKIDLHLQLSYKFVYPKGSPAAPTCAIAFAGCSRWTV